MSVLFSVVAPVFALILMGAATPRLNLMDLSGLRGLNDFVYWVALPALLFGSVIEARQLHLLGAASAYFAAALVVYALAMLLSWLMLRAGLSRAGMVGLNSSYGNTVMLGIPVIAAAYGDEGVANLLPIIALHSAVLLPLASVIVEAGALRGGHPLILLRRTMPALLRNPIIAAIILAFLWRAVGIPVPDALRRLLSLLGAAGPPLALFCLGAALPGLRVAALAEAALATALKLVLMPAMVGLLAYAAGVRGLPFAVAIITAGMPTGANAFLLARRMETLADASASTVVISTALSVVTLSVLLVWLR